MNFLIPTHIFPVDFYVYFNEKSEGKIDQVATDIYQLLLSLDVIDKSELNSELFSSVLNWNNAKTISFDSCSNVVLLYFPELPKNNYDLSVIAHEVLHAIGVLSEIIGLKFSTDSEETFCYLLDYTLQEIYNKIGLKISYSPLS